MSVPVQVIAEVARFAGLGTELMHWIAERSRIKTAAPSEVVFWEGNDCDGLYLVLDGTVKISKYLESGKELILDIFGAGDAFGEIALIDGTDFPATAEALEECRILVLPKRDYNHLLRHHPEVALAVVRDLTLRIRELSSRLQVIGGGAVEYRLACILVTLVRNQQEPLISLSRQDLANLAGARLETVVRALRPMVDEGIITTRRNQIEVLDVKRLRELAVGFG